MRVVELATDLGVSSKILLNLLRSMLISAPDEDATISEGSVALILARLERERRSGHKDTAEAIEAAIVDAKPSAGKRRRRRKSELPPGPAPETPDPETQEAVDPAGEATEEVAASGPDSDEDFAEAVEPDPVAVDVEGDEVVPKLDIYININADTDPESAAPEEPTLEAEPEAQVEEGAEAEAEAQAPVVESPEPAPQAPPPKRPEPARQATPEGPARVIRRPKPAATSRNGWTGPRPGGGVHS